MGKDTEHKYREIIKRYCNIIDANAAILRTDNGTDVSYECLSMAQCEKQFGGCRNKKYGNIKEI